MAKLALMIPQLHSSPHVGPNSSEIRTESATPTAAIQTTAGPQRASGAVAVEIGRDMEITAMGVGRQFAANPNRGTVRQINMAAFSSEIQYKVKNEFLREFTPGWAIIGDKPGGVEGGFTVRRVYTGNMMEFFQTSPEGFEQLQRMSQENDMFLPLGLRAENLGDKPLLDAFHDLPKSQQEGLAYMIMDRTPAYQKSYMVKVVFGKEDVESNGTVFCKPNPKGRLHRFFTKRSANDINKEVLQEFAALQAARALSPELAPEALLGKVKTDKHGERYFLMTEMAGSGDADAKFMTLGDENADVQKDKVDGEFAGLAYALTVGLLGDRDANKNGNVGLLKRGNSLPKPFLFDLGHPDPNGYELDAATLLPKRTSEGSIGFFLGRLNKSDVLDSGARRQHLTNLLEHRTAVEDAMQQALAQLPPEVPERKVLEDMNNEFTQRMNYLDRILRPSVPNAPPRFTGDPRRHRGSRLTMPRRPRT
jgi:hypothetical protein